MSSEFFQVYYDYGKINGIWYWNTQDDKKIRVYLLKQEFHEDLGAITGELKFQGNDTVYGFSCIEGTFRIKMDEEEFKEFEYESSEE